MRRHVIASFSSLIALFAVVVTDSAGQTAKSNTTAAVEPDLSSFETPPEKCDETCPRPDERKSVSIEDAPTSADVAIFSWRTVGTGIMFVAGMGIAIWLWRKGPSGAASHD